MAIISNALKKENKLAKNSLVATVMSNLGMRKYAKDNSTEMFVRSLFPDKFRDIVTQCFLDNNDSFAKLFNDPDFYQKVQDAMAAELYKALRKE